MLILCLRDGKIQILVHFWGIRVYSDDDLAFRSGINLFSSVVSGAVNSSAVSCEMEATSDDSSDNAMLFSCDVSLPIALAISSENVLTD